MPHDGESQSTSRAQKSGTVAGTKVNDAIVSTPAYYNDSQRQATKNGGSITARHGSVVLHGLTFNEAINFTERFSLASPAKAPPSSTESASDSDLVSFPETLIETVAKHSQRNIQSVGEALRTIGEIGGSPLRNAARNIVRARGGHVHKVPAGKCSRVLDVIASTLASTQHAPILTAAQRQDDNASADIDVASTNEGTSLEHFDISSLPGDDGASSSEEISRTAAAAPLQQTFPAPAPGGADASFGCIKTAAFNLGRLEAAYVEVEETASRHVAHGRFSYAAAALQAAVNAGRDAGRQPSPDKSDETV